MIRKHFSFRLSPKVRPSGLLRHNVRVILAQVVGLVQELLQDCLRVFLGKRGAAVESQRHNGKFRRVKRERCPVVPFLGVFASLDMVQSASVHIPDMPSDGGFGKGLRRRVRKNVIPCRFHFKDQVLGGFRGLPVGLLQRVDQQQKLDGHVCRHVFHPSFWFLRKTFLI